ncbi:MAG: GxxExxY protein, partial [Prevotella sp.]|nr:GxxExxY protein [Prevotella sp.]
NNHRAQLFNYMRLSKLPCGILVNFAPIFAKIERYFYDDELKEILTVDGKMVRLSA